MLALSVLGGKLDIPALHSFWLLLCNSLRLKVGTYKLCIQRKQVLWQAVDPMCYVISLLLLCSGEWCGRPLVSQGSSCPSSCSGVCQVWGAVLPDPAAHHAGTQLSIPADQQPSQHSLWYALSALTLFVVMTHLSPCVSCLLYA